DTFSARHLTISSAEALECCCGAQHTVCFSVRAWDWRSITDKSRGKRNRTGIPACPFQLKKDRPECLSYSERKWIELVQDERRRNLNQSYHLDHDCRVRGRLRCVLTLAKQTQLGCGGQTGLD